MNLMPHFSTEEIKTKKQTIKRFSKSLIGHMLFQYFTLTLRRDATNPVISRNDSKRLSRKVGSKNTFRTQRSWLMAQKISLATLVSMVYFMVKKRPIEISGRFFNVAFSIQTQLKDGYTNANQNSSRKTKLMRKENSNN